MFIKPDGNTYMFFFYHKVSSGMAICNSNFIVINFILWVSGGR